MKQHNVSTIDVLENRLYDHNHQALVVATEIQANLDDLENYLLTNKKLKNSRRLDNASPSANSKQDDNQVTKL